MRRRTANPRDNWQKRVEKVGLTYHTLADGSPYWDESAYWEFSAREIDRLEAATNEIQRLALAAGDIILNQNRLGQMGIPAPAAHDAIRTAWNAEPPALYGRRLRTIQAVSFPIYFASDSSYETPRLASNSPGSLIPTDSLLQIKARFNKII